MRDILAPIATGSAAFALIVLVWPTTSIGAKLAAAAYCTLLIAGGLVAVVLNIRATERRYRAAMPPDQRRKAARGRRF